MGNGKSTGAMKPAVIRRFFDKTDHFAAGRLHLVESDQESPGCDALATYSILGSQLQDRVKAANEKIQQLRSMKDSSDVIQQKLNRSLGCVLGNVVGDALGAPLEFSPVRYNSNELKGMCHDEIWNKDSYNQFRLKPGQWTDDAAMGLCIADSLLCCNGFNAYDLRHRFHAWNCHGYNNAFGRDAQRSGLGSVGLGGNISMSMNEWTEEGNASTECGNEFTSGNGSVMRNGAVPVWFHNDIDAGLRAAYQQSRTTHRGEEAAECCRLLTFVCVNLINGAGRELLEDLGGFKSPSYAVTCLAAGQCEQAHPQNADPIFGGLERRRWDWKAPSYQYCKFRAEENPGYIGSYAMDCLCMALHCVYSTQSFEEATLKAANLRGDSDSVCAVVGQIAGAMYGVTAIPAPWIDRVQEWDGGTIAARALMLHQQESVGADVALSDAACETASFLGNPGAFESQTSPSSKKQKA